MLLNMGRKKINKDSYSYYKTSYKANERYRKKIGNDDYGALLSRREFEEAREAGLSTQDIVYNQFHFYTKDTAKGIQVSLEQEGFKLSLKDIQARNYTDEMYARIDEIYWELTKTMDSKSAAALISYTFYGS